MESGIAVSMGIMRARGGASFRVIIGGVGEGVRRHHSNDVEKKTYVGGVAHEKGGR